MLDAIEKSREELYSAIATLQGKLDSLMKDSTQTTDTVNESPEKQPQSELMRRLENINDDLCGMKSTVESISDRLNIPW